MECARYKGVFETISKIFTGIFFIIALYALIEFGLGRNVFADFCWDYGLVENLMGAEDSCEHFGILRCNSILPYSSALGMLSSVVFFILLNLRALNLHINKRQETMLLFLQPFCVLLSGTRSQFGVFVICLIPIFSGETFLKQKQQKSCCLQL